MARALITGVGGFAGQHLAAHLLSMGDAVWGVARRAVDWHAPTVPTSDRFTLLYGDLLSVDDTRRVIAAAQPESVYHLAARSSVHESFADPTGVLHDNSTVLVNVLETVRALAPRARVLVVSSSEIYGRASDDSPLDERAELRPESPYAVSKATQDLLGYQYFVAHRLHIVRVRPFNYLGPGQSDRFVAASIARQIAEIEAGEREPFVSVGNLDAQRDFTDVRDMVVAFELALRCGEPGRAYNLGSGVAVSIRALVDRLLARSVVPVQVRIDPLRLRPADPSVSVCNPTLFRQRTGWEPRISLDASLEALLRYWRDRVGSPSLP